MIAFFSTFLTISVLQGFLGSNFVTEDQIESAVKKCCPESMQECCRVSLQEDMPIRCASHSSSRSTEAAICLEEHFYNGSIIKTGAHKCCWLMSTETCFQECEHNLLQPTLPFPEKFSFIDECPSGGPPEEIQGRYACLYKKHPLRECFSLCRGWTEKKMAQVGWNERETSDKDEFEPLRDCPAYKRFIESNACIFNTEK